MAQLHSGIGLLAIFAIAWALSEDRRAVGWRVPAVGIVLQVVLALAMLKVAVLRDGVAALNDAFLALQAATKAGTSWSSAISAGQRCRSRRPIRAPPSCWRSRRCRWFWSSAR